tara:strand:+ start:5578 stop:5694 length:117 start_codon:yes stop_codon:yes gene_type:complete
MIGYKTDNKDIDKLISRLEDILQDLEVRIKALEEKVGT